MTDTPREKVRAELSAIEEHERRRVEWGNLTSDAERLALIARQMEKLKWDAEAVEVVRRASSSLALPPEPAPSGEREAAEIAIMGAIQKAWLNGVNGIPVEVRPTAERIVAAHWPSPELCVDCLTVGGHKHDCAGYAEGFRTILRTPPLAPAGASFVQVVGEHEAHCNISRGSAAGCNCSLRALPSPVEPEAVAWEPEEVALVRQVAQTREPRLHAIADKMQETAHEYTAVERNCTGCSGPCGQCASPPDTRASEVTEAMVERAYQVMRDQYRNKALISVVAVREALTAALTPPAKTTEGT